MFTHSGQGTFHIEGGDYDLSPGTALLTTCLPPHDYRTVGDSWVHSWMHLHGSGPQALDALLTGPVQLQQPRDLPKYRCN